jgi:hypothetical protein
MASKPIKIVTFIFSLAAVLFIEFLGRTLIARFAFTPWIGLGVIRLAQLTVLILVVYANEKGLATFGITKTGTPRAFKRGIIWAVGFGCAALLVYILLLLFGIDAVGFIRTSPPTGLHKIMSFFLVGVLIGPLVEEVFFRGIIYGFFRRWGIAVAMIMSIGLFLLAHPLGSGIPIPQLVGGVLFTVAYEVEKNLIVPVIIHCLGNLAIFSLGMVL